MANKGNVWDQLRPALVKAGYTENEIDNCRAYVKEYNPKYISESEFGDHAPKGTREFSGLENLTSESINDVWTKEEFLHLYNSPNDSIPLLAKKAVTEECIDIMSDAAEDQYWIERQKVEAEKKNESQIAQQNTKAMMLKRGKKTASEELQQNTIKPDQPLGKESLSYSIHDGLGNYHLLQAKSHFDIRDQIGDYGAGYDIQKEHREEFLKFRDDVIVPLANIDAYLMNFHKSIMDNVTDEKYGDTHKAWLKNGVDKFWNAGNHGSGEINSIMTGKYITKLKNNQNEIDEALELGNEPPEYKETLVEYALTREWTREEIADKTVFHFDDIRKKNVICPKCDHKFEFMYKMIPIEVANSMFGDVINKSYKGIVGNSLSNMLETICDHVAIRQLRSPVELIKYHRKGVTDAELEKIDFIFGGKIKMKEVEVDSKAISKLAYNIIYGRAGRRANKAEHFSDVA